MNILFIGGTGNISSACAQLLHQRGHHITLLTRGKHDIPSEYASIVADRNAPGALKQAMQGRFFDVIADFICFDESDARTAFEACQGHCGQYIFISTTVVYAKPPAVLPITETAPKGNKFSEYGRGKERAEEYFLQRQQQDGFPLTIVRPSHTYSNSWLPNPVTSVGYTLAYRLENRLPIFVHDDGQGLWTLTHVRDFAVGFAGLCGQPACLGEDYQITGDMVLTWNQIITETAWALGLEHWEVLQIPTSFICEVIPEMSDKLLGDKACPGVFDCAKLKSQVRDFNASITFKTGIRESIAWFKADPRRQVVNQEHNQVFDKIIAAWKAAGH
jgi:nucleoside-diphosphate-sugar epimerase